MPFKNAASRRLGRCLLAGLLAVACGSAQSAGGLLLSNQVFQEITVKAADGSLQRKTVPAVTVVPGTEVSYVITYRNSGAKPAEQVAITNPVPAKLEYVSSSTPGPASQVSVDGGKRYGALAELSLMAADGSQRPAKASDVTHVRWVLGAPVAPGSEGKVSFKARLR